MLCIIVHSANYNTPFTLLYFLQIYILKQNAKL